MRALQGESAVLPHDSICHSQSHPLPLPRSLAVKNGLEIQSRVSLLLIPMPVSETDRTAIAAGCYSRFVPSVRLIQILHLHRYRQPSSVRHGVNSRRYAPKISLIFSANWKSRLLIPCTLCVFRSITTLFHTLNHSG